MVKFLAGLTLYIVFLDASPASTEPRTLTDGLIRYAARDYAGALEILLPLAQQGNADAQLQLGRMYAQGEGLAASDDHEAAGWFSRAAEQGKVEAQFALGMMYANGMGVVADDGLALRWLRRAGDQGAPHALNAVGELLMHASSPEDRSEAYAWFLRAARLANAKALYHLGMLSALGRDVSKDDIEAYKWFDLAASAALGSERDSANRALLELRERMTPVQVERAKRSADMWLHRQVAVLQADPETP